MAHGYESLIAAAWLTQTLTGDSTLAGCCGTTLAGMALRVFDGTAPADTAEPYLIFHEQSAGQDTQGVNAAIIFTRPLFTVRAILSGPDYLPLAPIAARVHTLLHQQQGTVSVSSGGTVVITGSVQCARQSPFRMDFTDADGHPKRALGGIYQMYIQG
jgi:hypothetical protein